MRETEKVDPAPTAMSRSVSGLRVLVTGAARGMGRATAEVFAAEGAKVAVTDFDGDGAREVAEAIVANGGAARAWALDVARLDDITSKIPDITGHFGGLDIVINNAGVSSSIAIDDPDYEEDWDRNLTILLTAHQRIIRAALPYLRHSSCPRIINIASTEALGATARLSSYAAAKAGVTGLTRALAVELGRDGITVNCVCPGPILTGMTEAFPEHDREVFAKRRTALGRYGKPAEVAHATLSLCLPAASYITGVSLPVDGGLMARNA